MRRALPLAAALLCAFAPRVAVAIDKVEAEAIDFGDLEVVQALPSEDGSLLYLIEAPPAGGKAPKSRVLFWDLAKGEVARELKVPKSPTQLALAGGKLVVICPESEVVVVVDPAEKKIVKTIETQVDGDAVAPTSIVRDSPAGEAMIFCMKDREPGQLLRLEVEKAKLSFFCQAGPQAAFCKEYVIIHGGHGGLVHTRLSSLRLRNGPEGRELREQHRELMLAQARPANGGTHWIAPSTTERKTVLVSQNLEKQLWTTDGTLTALYRQKPIALLTASALDDGRASDKWTLRGIHTGSGRQVFRVAVTMPRPNGRFDVYNGPAIEVVEKKSGDELLFGLESERRRDGVRVRTWYRAALPKADADGGPASVGAEPPGEVAVGETFEWKPTLSKDAKAATYVLKQAPDGMTVDAKTGALTWKPDESSVGKHDVELVAKIGDDEFPILSYTLRVRAAKAKKPKAADPEDDE